MAILIAHVVFLQVKHQKICVCVRKRPLNKQGILGRISNILCTLSKYKVMNNDAAKSTCHAYYNFFVLNTDLDILVYSRDY